MAFTPLSVQNYLQSKLGAPKKPETPKVDYGYSMPGTLMFGSTNPLAKVAPTSKPTTPSNFNYSQVSPTPSVSTYNTAALDKVAPKPAGGGGFSAPQGSELASKVASMSLAAEGPKTPSIPTPASAGASSAVNMANLKSLAEQNLQKYQEQVLSSMSPSEQEKALAQELAQFRGDAAMGISGLEGQGRGIPLELIRGQQGKLAEQANIQEQTLLGRLSAAEQARQSQLMAAQTSLGFSEAELAREDAMKQAEAAGLQPIKIGDNLVAINPETGQYETVYQAPVSSATDLPALAQEFEYAKSQGYAGSFTDYQREKAGEFGAPSTSQGPATVQEYEYALGQGFQGSFLDYQRAKSEMGTSAKPPTAEQAKAGGFASRIQQATQIIDSLSSQFTGLASYAGAVLPEYFKSEDRKLLEQAQRNFVNAVLRRESGAAISQSEFNNAALQYFPQPGDTETVLTQKKQNRDTVYNNLLLEASGERTGQTEVKDDPLGLFNSAAGQALNSPVKQVAAAIKKVESGGNYNAKGGSGEFGAYQFMPATWKSWAKQYLGDPNAPMTQKNQDYVAEKKIKDLLNQGYTPYQVALVWNGGQPVVKKGVNKYGVAYDSGAYANKVIKALG